MDARNAARASHKTALGSLHSSAYGLFSGDSLASKGNKEIEAAKAFVTAQGNWKKALETEAIRNGADIKWKRADGTTFQATYRDVQNAMQNKKADENATLADGTTFRVGDFDAMAMEEQLKLQVSDYQGYTDKNGVEHAARYDSSDDNKHSYAELITEGQKLYGAHQDVIKAANDLELPRYNPNSSEAYKGYNADRNASFGASIGQANRIRSEQENSMRRRIQRASEKKK
jgi:hypothetical protein